MTPGWDDDAASEDEITPDDPDYDLSEAYGYGYEPPRARPPVARWLLVVVSLLLALALVVPSLIFLISRS